MNLFAASIKIMKWFRNIYKKSNSGKTQIYVFRGLRVKKVKLKLDASNNFANFTVKHLC